VTHTGTRGQQSCYHDRLTSVLWSTSGLQKFRDSRHTLVYSRHTPIYSSWGNHGAKRRWGEHRAGYCWWNNSWIQILSILLRN